MNIEQIPAGDREESFGLNVEALRQDRVLWGVFRYWRSKCRGRELPDRIDLDPTEIPGFLPHILLWDVLAGGGYRCRLAGTEIVESHGHELRGLTTAELHGAANDRIEMEYGAVVRSRRPHFVERPMYWHHRHYKHYRRLLLPLSHGGNEVAMLLSTATYFDTV
jgi:hypothetical protein